MFPQHADFDHRVGNLEINGVPACPFILPQKVKVITGLIDS